jgi:hypothetical protein
MDENYKRGAFREETDFAMRFLQAGYRFQFDPVASIIQLGARMVQRGGARSWSNPLEWHDCIGDWYFNLRFARGRSAIPLLWFSFRHLIASRKHLHRPWPAILSAICWCLSMPVAFWLRLRGPRLITVDNTNDDKL